MREWIANYCNFPRFMMQMLNFRAGFFRGVGVPGGHLLKVWRHGLVNKITHSDTQVLSAVLYCYSSAWAAAAAAAAGARASQAAFHREQSIHTRRRKPRGCDVFTKVGLPIMQLPPAPLLLPPKNLYHTSQERMIWYVGQYPFCSEPVGEICVVARCHSDYWGDTERLSWSGMTEPAVWDSCVIAATMERS